MVVVGGGVLFVAQASGARCGCSRSSPAPILSTRQDSIHGTYMKES